MNCGSVGKFPIQVLQSWGVASARHTSGSVVPSNTLPSQDTEFLFDAPIGPSVVRWDIAKKHRVAGQQFQAHRDLVTCMRWSPSGHFIVTTCYSGGVRLWRGEGWELLDQTEAPMASQHHLAWSHDSKRFVIVGNGVNSCIVVYGIEEGSPSNTPQLKQLWQVSAGKSHTKVKGQSSKVGDCHPPSETNSSEAMSGSGQEEGVQLTGKDYNYGDAFYMAEITPAGNVLAVEERHKAGTYVHLYSSTGKLLCVKGLVQQGARDGETRKSLHTLFISSYKDGYYALGMQGGLVLLVDAESLEITSSIKVDFNSRTCVWDGNTLVLPSDGGKLSWWSTGGEKLHEFKVGSADYIVRLDWSVSGHALWMCGFSTLSYLEVSRNANGSITAVAPTHAVHTHEITCCGVGFSPNGELVAVGDLAGNVWVTDGLQEETKYKCSVGMSVRCIVWSSDTSMLVGCLDGLVHQWRVGGGAVEEEEGEGSNPRMLFAMEGSIIHMRWNHTRKALAVGTSKGVVGIYASIHGTDTVHPLTSFTAHHPKGGHQDPRFGQLNKQAEVWSLCWSPDDSMLATCSEDQTTKIWDTANWTCLATLTGHTMAVTSVDWKVIEGRSILATCADDRTIMIRVMDGHSFSLLHTFNTKEIYGWHTLTYLTFDSAKDSRRLVCTTQNGHVIVWDVLSGKKIACGKFHCGSVEGLSWNPVYGRFVSVGADCIAHLMKIA